MSPDRKERLLRGKSHPKGLVIKTEVDKAFYETLAKEFDKLRDQFNVQSEQREEETKELLNALETISQNTKLADQLKQLEQAITGIEIPDNKQVVIEGLSELVKAVRENKPKEFPKISNKEVVSGLRQLRKAVEKQTVGQEPSDYTPVRRVILAGNRLIYDDSTGGGVISSGGGGIQDSLVATVGGNQAIRITGSITASIDTTGLATDATDTNTAATASSVDSVDDKTPALGQALSAASTPVVLPATQITTLTPPAAITGFATSAKQDTIIGHVDGIEGLLGGTLAVSNAGLTELAAAINSSKIDVNIVSSDVATGGTSAADDADFTAGTTAGTPAMGVFDSTPDSVTDGDLGTIGINSTRAVRTVIEAGNANIGDVDVASSALPTGASTSAKQDTVIGHLDGVEGLLTTIDGDTGTLAGAVSGSEMQVDVVGALPAGTNNIGDVDVLTVPADPFGVNADAASATGSISAKLRFIAGTGIPITGTVAVTQSGTWDEVGINDSGNSITVDNGGTFAVQGTGTVADDATTPGNPVMIGGKAVETDGTDPTSVSAEDDVAILRTDRNRRMLVNTYHPNLWSVNEDHTTAQTNNELKAAPGANLSLYITDIVVSNGAVAGSIEFFEDTGGTPVQKVGIIYMAINGGAVMNFSTPIRITANKNFGFTSTTSTTHGITVNGFTAP